MNLSTLKTIDKIDGYVVTVEKAIIFLVFIALIVDLTLQVLFRFLIDQPLDFTEELARVLFAWLVYIGAAHAVYRSEHFLVDILYNNLNFTLQRTVAFIVDFFVFVFVGFLAWKSFNFTVAGAGQVLPVMDVTVAWQNGALPTGFLFMFIHRIAVTLRRFSGDDAKAIAP